MAFHASPVGIYVTSRGSIVVTQHVCAEISHAVLLLYVRHDEAIGAQCEHKGGCLLCLCGWHTSYIMVV